MIQHNGRFLHTKGGVWCVGRVRATCPPFLLNQPNLSKHVAREGYQGWGLWYQINILMLKPYLFHPSSAYAYQCKYAASHWDAKLRLAPEEPQWPLAVESKSTFSQCQEQSQQFTAVYTKELMQILRSQVEVLFSLSGFTFNLCWADQQAQQPSCWASDNYLIHTHSNSIFISTWRKHKWWQKIEDVCALQKEGRLWNRKEKILQCVVLTFLPVCCILWLQLFHTTNRQSFGKNSWKAWFCNKLRRRSHFLTTTTKEKLMANFFMMIPLVLFNTTHTNVKTHKMRLSELRSNSCLNTLTESWSHVTRFDQSQYTGLGTTSKEHSMMARWPWLTKWRNFH